MLSQLLTLSLMALGPSVTLGSRSEFATVETIDNGDAQIVAYDSSGAVVALLAIWKDRRGDIHITADYGDGSAVLITDATGELVSFNSSLDAATLHHRTALLIGRLSLDEQAGWVTCGATAGAAVGFWASGNPISGAFLTIMAYCGCAEAAKTKYMPECG